MPEKDTPAYYKHLQITYKKSYKIMPWSNVCGLCQEPTLEWSTWKELNLNRPSELTNYDYAGKAGQVQTL